MFWFHIKYDCKNEDTLNVYYNYPADWFIVGDLNARACENEILTVDTIIPLFKRIWWIRLKTLT
jgi:hypothetical protein